MTPSLEVPEAVLLLVCRGIAGWGWPSSSRVMRMGHASLPLWKRAASLASVALDMTSRMIWQRILMAPFEGGGGASGLGALFGFLGLLLR